MRQFTQLCKDLDASIRTRDKLEALTAYFAEVQPEDAVWALWFLLGNRLRLGISSRRLRQWAADLAGYPDWLVEACYERVGDLAETTALLLPLQSGRGTDQTLHAVIETRLLPLKDWDDRFQLSLLREFWLTLDRDQAFVLNKMLTGGFRVGASRLLVIRALAEALGIDRSTLTHRLMGAWDPTAPFFRSLTSEEANSAAAVARPYPFYLASPLEGPVEDLGDPADWQAEWKWDGIRAQLIRRGGEGHLWSRGDDPITTAFPEIITAAQALPEGTVLDGEILCWRDDQPMGFHVLQTRLNRKKPDPVALSSAPAIFMAYDCLESGGRDIREEALSRRRVTLEEMLAPLPEPAIRLSPVFRHESWEILTRRRERSRAEGVEGLILKRHAGTYRVGRVRGEWWKWKVRPYTADLVLIYAQAGHGRRATLYTDYTLAARAGDKLVPVAKAYSGLTDQEIRQVDAWIKSHTLARRGPVRTVPAELVFEIEFEGLRPSTRHKSGLAMRFPRIARWRRDKPVAEIDTVDSLREQLDPDQRR